MRGKRNENDLYVNSRRRKSSSRKGARALFSAEGSGCESAATPAFTRAQKNKAANINARFSLSLYYKPRKSFSREFLKRAP